MSAARIAVSRRSTCSVDNPTLPRALRPTLTDLAPQPHRSENGRRPPARVDLLLGRLAPRMAASLRSTTAFFRTTYARGMHRSRSRTNCIAARPFAGHAPECLQWVMGVSSPEGKRTAAMGSEPDLDRCYLQGRAPTLSRPIRLVAEPLRRAPGLASRREDPRRASDDRPTNCRGALCGRGWSG